MGKFKDWVKVNVDKPSVKSPDDLFLYWTWYANARFSAFSAYGRSLEGGARTNADIDPEGRLTAAQQRVAAAGADLQQKQQAIAGYFNELDAFSDHVEKQAENQNRSELAAVVGNRTPVAEEPAAPQGELPAVRLQLQTNFKMKGGNDTLATEVVSNANGVSAQAVGDAFTRLETASGLNKKLKSQMQAALEVHKGKWSAYSPGNSYSVYFDYDWIKTSGRPRDGYRLDIEVLRANGKPMFF